ncbi:hypothetical protein CHARACLAT_003423, partial [Characodon lateralis]|nr:hypothetical protein [Characodon lateralis]
VLVFSAVENGCFPSPVIEPGVLKQEAASISSLDELYQRLRGGYSGWPRWLNLYTAFVPKITKDRSSMNQPVLTETWNPFQLAAPEPRPSSCSLIHSCPPSTIPETHRLPTKHTTLELSELLDLPSSFSIIVAPVRIPLFLPLPSYCFLHSVAF